MELMNDEPYTLFNSLSLYRFSFATYTKAKGTFTDHEMTCKLRIYVYIFTNLIIITVYNTVVKPMHKAYIGFGIYI